MIGGMKLHGCTVHLVVIWRDAAGCTSHLVVIWRDAAGCTGHLVVIAGMQLVALDIW